MTKSEAHDVGEKEVLVMIDITVLLVIAKTTLNGIAAGASLDQSIKQLPARHRIGVVAYSAYSQASDMGNGLFWYAGVGISAVLLPLATVVVAFVQRVSPVHAVPIAIVAGLFLLYMLITLTRAALILLSQRRAQEAATLSTLFDRFERWQTIRVLVMC
jgi:hypothetical protein